jgi:hypothetical protein
VADFKAVFPQPFPGGAEETSGRIVFLRTDFCRNPPKLKQVW